MERQWRDTVKVQVVGDTRVDENAACRRHGTDVSKYRREQWQYLKSTGQTPNAKKSNVMNKNSE